MAFADTEPEVLPQTDQAEMAKGWSSGRPAFQVRPLRLDASRIKKRFGRLVQRFPPKIKLTKGFLETIHSRRSEIEEWVAQILVGCPGEVVRRASSLGVDPSWLLSTLRIAILPSLAKVSLLLDRSRPEGLWDQGDCPNCGSPPLFAESRGLEQRIFFRCGLCAADWAGERLCCPACTEHRSHSLRIEYVDGEQEKCRLVHCHSCRYHWRVVSTLTPLSAPEMIVADLATIHLELIFDESRARPD